MKNKISYEKLFQKLKKPFCRAFIIRGNWAAYYTVYQRTKKNILVIGNEISEMKQTKN